MSVGEEVRRQVELFPKDVLGDLASKVVFDGVFCVATAAQHAPVCFGVSFLVSSVRAPSVPKGAKRCSADSRWYELL